MFKNAFKYVTRKSAKSVILFLVVLIMSSLCQMCIRDRDSDTIAAITGSIAEAAYGIPEDMKEKAYAYLDEPLKDVLRRWKKYMRGG